MRSQKDTYFDELYICNRGKRKAVFTRKKIPAGNTILRMQGEIMSRPDVYSIQIDTSKHLGPGGLIDDEMNHSCDANARINFDNLTIESKKDIEIGEEVCINYCATEEELASPFTCDCGNPRCYGIIKGFKHLNEMQRKSIKNDLSPYLQKKYFG